MGEAMLDLQTLFDRYLEDSLDPAEEQALAEAIRRDPAAFRAAMEDRVLLAEALKDAAMFRRVARSNRVVRITTWVAPLAAAALLAVAVRTWMEPTVETMPVPAPVVQAPAEVPPAVVPGPAVRALNVRVHAPASRQVTISTQDGQRPVTICAFATAGAPVDVRF